MRRAFNREFDVLRKVKQENIDAIANKAKHMKEILVSCVHMCVCGWQREWRWSKRRAMHGHESDRLPFFSCFVYAHRRPHVRAASSFTSCLPPDLLGGDEDGRESGRALMANL